MPLLQEAIDAFLSQPDLAPTSRRSYGQATGRLEEAWGRASPRTSNRHLSALDSFVAFCCRGG